LCFSPEADFTAAAVVGIVGVETLRRVRARRELIVGALPLLFAVHQCTEGFVWLGLRGAVSPGLGDTAKTMYVVYAYAALPMIVPIGLYLIEPSRKHRRWVLPFVALGLAVGGYLLWQVTQFPVTAQEHASCIAYSTHTPFGTQAAVAYVIATCGPALLSSRRYLQWFGVANIGGVAIALSIREADFTSVWCVYAALVNVLILEHFRRQRRADVPHELRSSAEPRTRTV
jgi:Trk-type K+ transport system membrane component